MTFHGSAIFPDDIGVRSAASIQLETGILVLRSGREYRLQRWSQARRRYDVAYGVRSQSEVHDLQKFYLARNGAEHGFLFLDPIDYTTNQGGDDPTTYDEVLCTADGTTEEYQLFKTYRDGLQIVKRALVKPISSGALVYRYTPSTGSGTALSSPTHYSIDEATGEIDFVTGVLTAGDVVSFGLKFYVPCRFTRETDYQMLINWDYANTKNVPNVALLEEPFSSVPPFAEVSEMIPLGDAVNHGSVAANMMITPAGGRVHYIEPSTNITVYIEGADAYEAGDCILVLILGPSGTSRTVTIKSIDDEATSLATITTNSSQPRTIIMNIAEEVISASSKWWAPGYNKNWFFWPSNAV